MARSQLTIAPRASRLLRRSVIASTACALILSLSILNPTYAYGARTETLSEAKAALTKANNELTAAVNELTAAQKALTTAQNNLTAAQSSANTITKDVVISGQVPLYVPANGNTGKPANSTLVGVEGKYVNEGKTQQEVLNYINQVRRDAYNTTAADGTRLASSYKPITWSKNLERTAQVRAAEISIYGDHTRPSGEAWYGVSDEGLMQGSAENLSWGASYMNNIKMWADEKADYIKYLNCSKGRTVVNGVNQCNYGIYGHYRNLVNPQYDKVGLAQFNTNRSTVNPYGTAMAAEFSYSANSQSADVKSLNVTVYQGVYAKTAALGAIGAGGATSFSPAKVAGDPVWTRAAQVKESKGLATALGYKPAGIASLQSAVTTAQNRVTTAQNKVKAAQTNVASAKARVVALGGTVPKDTQDMYRLYNSVTGEHLYTSDAHERDVLSKKREWKYEGVAWIAPIQGQNVHRLFNTITGEHHYTLDTNEVRILKTRGWRDEGVKFHSDPLKGVPVYRQFDPAAGIGAHHYTKSKYEYDTNNKHGWTGEGVAWYGVKVSASATSNVTRVSLPFSLDTMAAYQKQNPYYSGYTNSQLRDFVDPNRVGASSPEYLQFADLRSISGLSTADINTFIASTATGRSGNLIGLGYLFIQAAQQYNINEAYLVSHAVLESGWGTSQLAKGYYYDGTTPIGGKLYPAGTYYNYYGIGAYDSSPLSGGRAMAIKNGWNSRTAAIIGAAQWISTNYIHGAGAHTYDQPTLYAMKWDYDRSAATKARGWHQYASDVQWPTKIATLMNTCYSLASNNPLLSYIFPQYQ